MNTVSFTIGIDIGSEECVAAIYVVGRSKCPTTRFANTDEGFEALRAWLSEQHISTENSIACMEATGVYGEALTYFLATAQWRIAVEAPQHIRRGMSKETKNDHTDACQIAEYAYRYGDQLTLWQIPQEILKRIETLLSTREHCVKHRTATQNMRTALRRHVVRTPFAEKVLDQQCNALKEQITAIDKELRSEIDSDPYFKQMVDLARSVPGVGMLMGAHFLVLTNGFTEHLNYRHIASYLGVCPHEHSSASSVYRKPRSRRFGPPALRQLFHLAAMSARRHQQRFGQYYERKKAEHKAGYLILNNIANKILKVLCAVINSKQKYQENHTSLRPAKKSTLNAEFAC
jgi:transposase